MATIRPTQPLKAYPHLQPLPGTPPTAIVQIGLADVNLLDTPADEWPADCAYVLYKTNEERSRPTRILFTSAPVEGWRMGSVVTLYQGGSMNELGTYMVVAVFHGPTGENAGGVPDRKIKACLVR